MSATRPRPPASPSPRAHVKMLPETLALILARQCQEGRCDRHGAACRHHGRQADGRSHPALPSADAHPRSRSISRQIAALPGLRVEATAKLTGKTGVEMEALTAVIGRLPDHLRHGQGCRQGDGDRRYPAARKVRRQIRRLSASGGMMSLAAGFVEAPEQAAPRRSARHGGPKRSPLARGRGPRPGRRSRGPADAAALRYLRHGWLCASPRRRRRTRRRADTSSASRPPDVALRAVSATARPSASSPARRFPRAPIRVLLQEDAEKIDGGIRTTFPSGKGQHIRPRGQDFRRRRSRAPDGHVLDFARLTVAAGMNHAELSTFSRSPLVAILATGDELLPPGSTPGPASDHRIQYLWHRSLARARPAPTCSISGSSPTTRPRSRRPSTTARDAGADVIVTLGGRFRRRP